MNRYKTRTLILEEDIGRRLSKPKINEASVDNDYYGDGGGIADLPGDTDDLDLDQGGLDQDFSDDAGDMDTGTDLATPEDMPDMGGQGASAKDDTAEMLGMIGYLQDMGMSMSNNHYDLDMLSSKDPEFIRRVYSKVAGNMAESKKTGAVPGIAFINTTRLTEGVESDQRQMLTEQADPDIVNLLKRLNRS